MTCSAAVLGADSFVGGAGRDVMYVDAQDISIQGGDGFDIVYADAGTAATGLRFALAGTGVEAAFGDAGSDVLDASGTGIYTNVFGGDGNDVLIAGSKGNYTLQGGAGSDTAVFAGNQSDYAINGGTRPAGRAGSRSPRRQPATSPGCRRSSACSSPTGPSTRRCVRSMRWARPVPT